MSSLSTDAPSITNAAPDLILASASPRRRELLTQIGVRHAVHVADINEDVLPDELPENYVLRLAQAKARAVAAGLAAKIPVAGKRLPVLGADTTVVIEGSILGKPRDADDALAMLRRLAGREHRVLTAIALHTNGNTHTALSTTRVWFRACDDALLARYVRSGEPFDKAGAYGVQGLGAALVARIDGSYSGVVGLPLAETVDLLLRADIPFWRTAHD